MEWCITCRRMMRHTLTLTLHMVYDYAATARTHTHTLCTLDGRRHNNKNNNKTHDAQTQPECTNKFTDIPDAQNLVKWINSCVCRSVYGIVAGGKKPKHSHTHTIPFFYTSVVPSFRLGLFVECVPDTTMHMPMCGK